MKTRRRKRKPPEAPPTYYEGKAFDVYRVARAAAEAGRVHPRTLKRNGGSLRSYADYHAGRYTADILGRLFTPEDSVRLDRLWRSRGSA